MTIVFGFAKFGGCVTGVSLQDVTYGETCSTAEALNENGDVEQTEVYAKKKTITVNGNVHSDHADALQVGGSLEVDSVTYIINTVTVKEAINGFKTFSCSGSAPFTVTENDTGGA